MFGNVECTALQNVTYNISAKHISLQGLAWPLISVKNIVKKYHQGIFDIRSAKASPGTNWVTDMNSYAVTVDEKTGEISVEMS